MSKICTLYTFVIKQYRIAKPGHWFFLNCKSFCTLKRIWNGMFQPRDLTVIQNKIWVAKPDLVELHRPFKPLLLLWPNWADSKHGRSMNGKYATLTIGLLLGVSYDKTNGIQILAPIKIDDLQQIGKIELKTGCLLNTLACLSMLMVFSVTMPMVFRTICYSVAMWPP